MTTVDSAVARTYQTLVEGGLALVPTDVGYGLIALGEAAVDRIYELKGRPLTKPCVTVADMPILDEVALPIEPGVRAWLEEVSSRTPLAVIAKFDPDSRLLGSMPAGVVAQATHNGTIATFLNAGPFVHQVAQAALEHGRIVVGSSANLSGTGNNADLRDVPESMRRGADVIVDRGVAWYGNEARLATTILDLTSGTFQRKGVNFALIERAWTTRMQASRRDNVAAAS